MEYQSALNDFDARIRSTQADMDRLKQDVTLYGKRLTLATQVQKMHESLEKGGYGSKLNAVIAEDSTADVERLLNQSQTTNNDYDQTKQLLAKAQKLSGSRYADGAGGCGGAENC